MRITLSIVAVMLSVGVSAGSASAAASPSISVTDVAFVPGSSGTVEQDIVYTNLPDYSFVDFTIPPQVAMRSEVDSVAEVPCSPSQEGIQGGCSGLSGSGVIRTYLESVRPLPYIGHPGNTVVYMQANVRALSLSAKGAITITPKADLLLSWNDLPMFTYADIGLAVYNLGPSASYGATITITGFYDPVVVSGSAPCQSAGRTVTCSVPTLYAAAFPVDNPSHCEPELIQPSCARLALHVSPPVGTPLRVTLTTVYPDPRTANNTITAFADLPAPYTPPPAPPGSRPGGPGAGSGPAGSATGGSQPSTVSSGTTAPTALDTAAAGDASPPPVMSASSDPTTGITPDTALPTANTSGLLTWLVAGIGGALIVAISIAAVLRRRARDHDAPLDAS